MKGRACGTSLAWPGIPPDLSTKFIIPLFFPHKSSVGHMYHIFISHYSVDGHLAMVSRATMNKEEYFCCRTESFQYIVLQYTQAYYSSVILQSCVIFNFLSNSHTTFHSSYTSLYPFLTQANAEGFLVWCCLYSSVEQCRISIFFIFIFLVAKDVHFRKYLFAISSSSFETSIQSFSPLTKWAICFLGFFFSYMQILIVCKMYSWQRLGQQFPLQNKRFLTL